MHQVTPGFSINDHNHGQGGIRTHGTVSGTPVFETGSFNRSDTCPTSPKKWCSRLF